MDLERLLDAGQRRTCRLGARLHVTILKSGGLRISACLSSSRLVWTDGVCRLRG